MTTSTRRQLLLAAGGLSLAALGGCVSTSTDAVEPMAYAPEPRTDAYRSIVDHGYVIPAIPLSRFRPEWRRQLVANPFDEIAGTIVVDTPNRHLYLCRGDGTAIRYGVGVGREGFEWSGRAEVGYKRTWPTWTPPRQMIGRQPELAKWADGMPPGLMNPLGARALYMFRDGRDTLYRIHGSPEWWTIGTAASSGCIRMTNQDVIELYGRVPAGSPVRVIPNPSMMV